MSDVGKTCDTCRFSSKRNEFDSFQCRRHAPKERKRPAGYHPQFIAQWPLVGSQDWCGDWENITERTRPPKPKECENGCPPMQICNHCQWPLSAKDGA